MTEACKIFSKGFFIFCSMKSCIIIKNYHENTSLFLCQFNLAYSKALEQSACIDSEILARFSFVNSSLFYFFSNVFNDRVDCFFLYQMNIIFISSSFILCFESFHILSCLHEFLFILSKTFQKN